MSDHADPSSLSPASADSDPPAGSPASADAPSPSMPDPSTKHRRLLTLVWIVLLLWGVSLALWWGQQEKQLAQSAPATAGSTLPAADATPVAAQPAEDPAPGAAAVDEAWWVSDSAGAPSDDRDDLALARQFDGAAAAARIAELAAPPFDGRRAGTEGGQAAAAYVADAFAAYGLEPAGDVQPDGSRSYFQEFPLDFFVTFTAPPVLELFGPDGQALGPYEFRSDFSSYVRGYAGQGDAEGPVVWANACRHDDFDAVDAVGAIVLCRLGGGEDATRNALEHGAAGLLLVGDPATQPIDRIGRYNTPLAPAPLPAFLINPDVADDLLTGSGYTLADLSIQFAGTPLATTARLSVALEELEGVNGTNVLGLLPGSDPAFADQVVVVGAHFDHVGKDPAGERCTRPALEAEPSCQPVEAAVYWGANDNASGAATLLEIARLWRGAGYRPRRSVLFAGWDAEEQGLWGSFHYVLSPTVALENTVAMLNLDMVGAGADVLSIDGPGPLANQLMALAPTFGITTTLGDIGRSDHVAFRMEGIDAAMPIWFGEEQESDPKLAHYHRPLDTASVIEPDKLQAVGELATLTLLNLASAEPELMALMDQRMQAVAAGDREAFLAASAPQQRAADGSWWDALRAASPRTLTAELSDVLVAGDVATATVRYDLTLASGSTQHIDGTVRLRRAAGGWQVGGPALSELAGDRLTLAYPPSLADAAAEVLALATSRRAAIARQLDLSPRPPAGRLILHPSSDSLRAAVGLTIPDSVTVWAAGNDAHIVARDDITRTAALTDALTLLALAQAGLSEPQAPWLWYALPSFLAGQPQQEAQAEAHLPALRQMLAGGESVRAAEFPSVLTGQPTPAQRAAAWAMTGYLLEQHGPQPMADLVAALARGGDADQAFQQALGQPAADFDAAWQSDWQSRIGTAQTQIDDLLTRRQAALLSGDREAFLATSDPANPLLLADDAAWFDRLQGAGASFSGIQLSGALKGLTAGGVLAELNIAGQDADGQPVHSSQTVRLLRRDGQLVYGGPSWTATTAGSATLLHSAGNAALAGTLAPLLDRAYQTIAARLGVAAAPLTVKLYGSEQGLRLASGQNLPAGVKAVAVPGGSLLAAVQPQAGSAAAVEVRNGLLDALVDHLFSQAGIPLADDNRWLRVGLGRLALQWVDPNVGWQQASRLADKIPLAAQQGRLWPLDQLPAPATLSAADTTLAQAQAWDAVSYLVQQAGREGLSALVQKLAAGATVDAALRSVAGASLADFQQSWQETTRVLHVPADWLALAEAFDVDRALAEAGRLAGDEFAGRATGTPGGQRAAEAIARAFGQLGLQPAGDDGSFMQTFPISITEPAGLPALTFHHDGQTLELVYRQDFLERVAGRGLGGEASGQVVWVRDPAYSDMQLDGKIALRVPSGPLDEEVRSAAEAGAGALILLTEPSPAQMLSHTPIAASQATTPTLPVLELTKDALQRLLVFSGHDLVELNTAPPALPLNLTAEAAVPLRAAQTRQGANVLALLPGSDPALADQVVILSAHFDGPGVDGAGNVYPGANDNAAGVAALLEIARSWQEAGVRPARPVLFAAWDGEELGQRGSAAWLARPDAPLTTTLGLLNLDNIGAGSGFFLTYQGDRNREALTNQALAVASTALNARADFNQIADVGDHTAFQQAGLPATLVTWAGANDDANTARDTADKLDPVKLRRSGQVVSLALRWLAEQ